MQYCNSARATIKTKRIQFLCGAVRKLSIRKVMPIFHGFIETMKYLFYSSKSRGIVGDLCGSGVVGRRLHL